MARILHLSLERHRVIGSLKADLKEEIEIQQKKLVVADPEGRRAGLQQRKTNAIFWHLHAEILHYVTDTAALFSDPDCSRYIEARKVRGIPGLEREREASCGPR